MEDDGNDESILAENERLCIRINHSVGKYGRIVMRVPKGAAMRNYAMACKNLSEILADQITNETRIDLAKEYPATLRFLQTCVPPIANCVLGLTPFSIDSSYSQDMQTTVRFAGHCALNFALLGNMSLLSTLAAVLDGDRAMYTGTLAKDAVHYVRGLPGVRLQVIKYVKKHLSTLVGFLLQDKWVGMGNAEAIVTTLRHCVGPEADPKGESATFKQWQGTAVEDVLSRLERCSLEDLKQCERSLEPMRNSLLHLCSRATVTDGHKRFGQVWLDMLLRQYQSPNLQQRLFALEQFTYWATNYAEESTFWTHERFIAYLHENKLMETLFEHMHPQCFIRALDLVQYLAKQQSEREALPLSCLRLVWDKTVECAPHLSTEAVQLTVVALQTAPASLSQLFINRVLEPSLSRSKTARKRLLQLLSGLHNGHFFEHVHEDVRPPALKLLWSAIWHPKVQEQAKGLFGQLAGAPLGMQVFVGAVQEETQPWLLDDFISIIMQSEQPGTAVFYISECVKRLKKPKRKQQSADNAPHARKKGRNGSAAHAVTVTTAPSHHHGNADKQVEDEPNSSDVSVALSNVAAATAFNVIRGVMHQMNVPRQRALIEQLNREHSLLPLTIRHIVSNASQQTDGPEPIQDMLLFLSLLLHNHIPLTGEHLRRVWASLWTSGLRDCLAKWLTSLLSIESILENTSLTQSVLRDVLCKVRVSDVSLTVFCCIERYFQTTLRCDPDDATDASARHDVSRIAKQFFLELVLYSSLECSLQAMQVICGYVLGLQAADHTRECGVILQFAITRLTEAATLPSAAASKVVQRCLLLLTNLLVRSPRPPGVHAHGNSSCGFQVLVHATVRPRFGKKEVGLLFNIPMNTNQSLEQLEQEVLWRVRELGRTTCINGFAFFRDTEMLADMQASLRDLDITDGTLLSTRLKVNYDPSDPTNPSTFWTQLSGNHSLFTILFRLLRDPQHHVTTRKAIWRFLMTMTTNQALKARLRDSPDVDWAKELSKSQAYAVYTMQVIESLLQPIALASRSAEDDGDGPDALAARQWANRFLRSNGLREVFAFLQQVPVAKMSPLQAVGCKVALSILEFLRRNLECPTAALAPGGRDTAHVQPEVHEIVVLSGHSGRQATYQGTFKFDSNLEGMPAYKRVSGDGDHDVYLYCTTSAKTWMVGYGPIHPHPSNRGMILSKETQARSPVGLQWRIYHARHGDWIDAPQMTCLSMAHHQLRQQRLRELPRRQRAPLSLAAQQVVRQTVDVSTLAPKLYQITGARSKDNFNASATGAMEFEPGIRFATMHYTLSLIDCIAKTNADAALKHLMVPSKGAAAPAISNLLDLLLTDPSVAIRSRLGDLIATLALRTPEGFEFVLERSLDVLSRLDLSDHTLSTRCQQFFDLTHKLASHTGHTGAPGRRSASLSSSKGNMLDPKVAVPMLLQKLRITAAKGVKGNAVVSVSQTVLSGILSLMSALLSRRPELVDLATLQLLLHAMAGPCLFQVPEHAARPSHGVALCTTPDAREQAFKLLTFVCTKTDVQPRLLNGLLEAISSKLLLIYDPRYHLNVEEFSSNSSGFVGLKNQGMTCYMNATVQQLFMQKYFRSGILGAKLSSPIAQQPSSPSSPGDSTPSPKSPSVSGMSELDSDDTDTDTDEDDRQKKTEKKPDPAEVIRELQRTLVHLQTSAMPFHNARPLVDACKSLQLMDPVYHQNDARDFFDKLVDRAETVFERLGGPTGKLLRYCFAGQTANQNIRECEHNSETLQPFKALDVDIKGVGTLETALEKMVQGEAMVAPNQLSCDDCQTKVDAVRRSCIKMLPNILVLHLKRFQLDFTTFQPYKLNSRLEFPYETPLDMYPYTVRGLSKDAPADPKARARAQYTLRGAIIHSGIVGGGHYYSFIRSDDGVWNKYDDRDVTRMDADDFPRECFGGFDRHTFTTANGQVHERTTEIVHSAYMLFYERVHPLDPDLDPDRPEESESEGPKKPPNKPSTDQKSTDVVVQYDQPRTGMQRYGGAVWAQNIRARRCRHLFDPHLASFMQTLLLQTCKPSASALRGAVDVGAFVLQFFVAVVLHSDVTVSGLHRWVKVFEAHFHSCAHSTAQFLQVLTGSRRIYEERWTFCPKEWESKFADRSLLRLMLEDKHMGVRKQLCRLASAAVKNCDPREAEKVLCSVLLLLRSAQRNILGSDYFFAFVFNICETHSQAVLAAGNFLPALIHFCVAGRSPMDGTFVPKIEDWDQYRTPNLTYVTRIINMLLLKNGGKAPSDDVHQMLASPVLLERLFACSNVVDEVQLPEDTGLSLLLIAAPIAVHGDWNVSTKVLTFLLGNLDERGHQSTADACRAFTSPAVLRIGVDTLIRVLQVEDSLQRKRLQYAILGNQRTEDGIVTRIRGWQQNSDDTPRNNAMQVRRLMKIVVKMLDTVPGTDKYLRKCVTIWALFAPFMKYHLRGTQQQQQLLARIEREAVNMGYTYKYTPMDEDEDEEEDELSSEDAHS